VSAVAAFAQAMLMIAASPIARANALKMRHTLTPTTQQRRDI
jgi:hypothetical protein